MVNFNPGTSPLDSTRGISEGTSDSGRLGEADTPPSNAANSTAAIDVYANIEKFSESENTSLKEAANSIAQIKQSQPPEIQEGQLKPTPASTSLLQSLEAIIKKF